VLGPPRARMRGGSRGGRAGRVPRIHLPNRVCDVWRKSLGNITFAQRLGHPRAIRCTGRPAPAGRFFRGRRGNMLPGRSRPDRRSAPRRWSRTAPAGQIRGSRGAEDRSVCGAGPRSTAGTLGRSECDAGGPCPPEHRPGKLSGRTRERGQPGSSRSAPAACIPPNDRPPAGKLDVPAFGERGDGGGRCWRGSSAGSLGSVPDPPPPPGCAGHPTPRHGAGRLPHPHAAIRTGSC
jgi:hypothetical protein